ncbi:hypothetical protein ACLB2K_028221 [Fragaria x ananassa]
MCMRKEYNFLTLMVPGPYSPGKCLDVYMRPLIDELQELWENGLPTFDRHVQTSFMMKAAVIFIISDFPAYEMLSGQQTKGYKACLKIKLEYCPRVKGPSVKGINSLVAHDIGCAIRSLVEMSTRTFYDLDQEEKWKV